VVRVTKSSLIGSRGRQAVGLQFLNLNWAFVANEQEQDFRATDLWLIARDPRRFDLGALLGAQVKTVESGLKRPQRDADSGLMGWWHYDTKDHF
jgi:hypothetical protein